MMRRRGITARTLEGEGGPPAVYGELRSPRATRTVVFYAHYDGQPVDPAQWTGAPWTPVLGIMGCLLLMFSLPAGNWWRLLGWLLIGLVIYFLYGKKHSIIREQIDKGLVDVVEPGPHP